jgi:plastocyanin
MVLTVVVVMALGGCSDDDNAKPDECVPVKGGEVAIEGTIAGWDPDCLEVAVGADVAFTAKLLDKQPHNLQVSGPGLSKPVGTGDPVVGEQLSLDVQFGEAGYHMYVCTIHANMEGSIYVEE